MNKIKQEKGITLLILCITVAVLMLLAGIAIQIGDHDADASIDGKLQGELQMVQHAVLEQYVKYKTTLNKSYLVGTDYENQIQDFMKQNYSGEVLTLKTSDERKEEYKKYYYLTPEDLESIGIKESEFSYVVNYYTGEVMNASRYETSMGLKLYVKGISKDAQSNPSY